MHLQRKTHINDNIHTTYPQCYDDNGPQLTLMWVPYYVPVWTQASFGNDVGYAGWDEYPVWICLNDGSV